MIFKTSSTVTHSDISIIIPIGSGESQHIQLLQQISTLPWKEIVIVPSKEKEREHREFLESQTEIDMSRVVLVPSVIRGRAAQLNCGAARATGQFLWFVHADTRIGSPAVNKMFRCLGKDADALWYFDLKFESKLKLKMWINELGLWLRSHFLGMPFGDQAFCIARDIFWKIGGFDSRAEYGEDHLFVWACRRKDIHVRAICARITTSARKYESGGWKKTTGRHLRMTYAQAWPEFKKWLAGT